MSIKKLFLLFILLIPINIFALTKAPIDVTQMDISELYQNLNNGVITSEQLVNIYLDRINTYNDQYKAVITINENAVNEAKELDKERSNGKVRSYLYGIPIIVKDNIDVEGLPTTGGSKALSNNYPKQNAYVIQKLKDAGAIIIAKANMSEFAFMASSSISSYGTTKNAYNLDYSPYGSSGGSAISVAASLAAAALGTDTNSSVRIPASANNIVGLRPTLGLVSREGILPYDPERDTIGTLTKTVKDSAILLNIINGYDSNDSKSINQQQQTYTLNSSSLAGYTIGIPNNFYIGSNDNSLDENKETYSEIKDLMTKAINILKTNGANIVYLDSYYTIKQSNWVNTSYSGYLFCDAFNTYIKGTMGPITNFNNLYNAGGRISSLDGYITECDRELSLDTKNATKQTYKDYLYSIYNDNKLDIIIYPSTKNKLLKIGESGLSNLSLHAASTVGFPAITVPLGFDSDDLPYGLEFMALDGNDNLLLNIASVYQELNYKYKLPSIAPSLYKIASPVKKLVIKFNNYQNKKMLNFIDKIWLQKASDYFKSYNSNPNIVKDATKLNTNYYFIKFLSFIFKIVLIIFLILFVLIILLLIRKKILKKQHKNQKRYGKKLKI